MTDTSTERGTRDARAPLVRTFLIADIRGYTQFTQDHGDEAAAELTAEFASLAREVIGGRDGEVIELRGDEALAVFESARRALRAAVELQARINGDGQSGRPFPVQIGIGIDAGEAIALEEGYRGAALNLASRLCGLAGPGEILASEGVAHLARKTEGLEYEQRGLVQLKGFDAPVSVLQVVAEQPDEAAPAKREEELEQPDRDGIERALPIGGFLGALPEGMLVARREELEGVRTAVAAVQAGSGRLVLLSGEPGVGKTRLAQEVTLDIRNRGFVICTGRCYEARQNVPFYPFLEALAQAYGAAPRLIRDQVQGRWSYLTRLLPGEQVTDAGVGETKEEQERLFWAVTGFLEAVSESAPLAILLDDLHWADTASLELLQHLGRQTRTHRILLLGTYRDVEVGRQHPLEGVLLELTRERLLDRIDLKRLDRDGTAALMAAAMGAEAMPPDLAALVHEQTEGNAFFTEEVVRALVDRGDLYREGDRWMRRPAAEIQVPESIRSVIGQRLSRLSAEAQEVLREASVLGQKFSFDDLLRMAERPEEELDNVLEESSKSALIRHAGEDDYSFNHALTQQALYAEISPRRRRRLHLAAGNAIEALPERVRNRRAAELAWHFLDGDDPEKALHYSLLAGDQAEAIFAHGEAERQYRTAVQLAEELGDLHREREAVEKLARSAEHLSKHQEALELLGRAAEMSGAVGDQEARMRSIAEMGRVHLLLSKPEEGLAVVSLAVLSNQAAPATVASAQLRLAHSRLLHMSGREAEALQAAKVATEQARQLGDDTILARAEAAQAPRLQVLGRPSEAAEMYERAIPVLIRLGDLAEAHSALNNLSILYLAAGDFATERHYLLRGLEAAEQFGQPDYIAFLNCKLGQNAFNAGDWKQAHVYLDRSLAVVRSVAQSYVLPYTLGALGSLAIGEGEWARAAGYLDESISAAGQLRASQGALQNSESLRGVLTILEGRPQEAIAALTRYSETGAQGVLWILAWAYLRRGGDEWLREAEKLLDEGLRLAEEKHDALSALHLNWVSGMLATEQGRWDAAAAALQGVIAAVRSNPYPYHEARALQSLGEMHQAKGEPNQARGRLEEAMRIFERLGAQRDIERAARQLDELRQND